MQKRAGECSAEDIENLMLITSNPRAYKTPDWFLNRQKVRSPWDNQPAQSFISAFTASGGFILRIC